MKTRFAARFLFLLFGAFATAHAADFRTVSEGGVVLYDAPSRQATPLYVVTRHYPLEVVVELPAWAKVRDHTGALSWIEKHQLAASRSVIVVAPVAEARVRPEEGAPLAFSAAQNVVLEVLEPAAGEWLRVRHADGADGYVRSPTVWGR